MPSYYGKNIAQHAQKKFLARHYPAGSPEACSSGPRVARRARKRETEEKEERRKKGVRILIADEIDAAGREDTVR